MVFIHLNVEKLVKNAHFCPKKRMFHQIAARPKAFAKESGNPRWQSLSRHQISAAAIFNSSFSPNFKGKCISPTSFEFSYQVDQIKSFEVDKFQSPAFPSSYLGGNKCSYTLQLDTFCPDWRNWSCFGEKISCCEEKVEKNCLFWRKPGNSVSLTAASCVTPTPRTHLCQVLSLPPFSHHYAPSNPLSSHSSSHSSLLATESYLVWHLLHTPSPP